jgi:parallel beta-helix repeat protein
MENEIKTYNYYYDEYQDGIALWHDSSNNSIIKNTISDNRRYGIDLRECLYNVILNNTLLQNKWGIRLYKSNYNRVMYNYITYYEKFILETESELNIIENNTCKIIHKFVPGYNAWMLYLILALTIILLIKRKGKKAR